MSAPRIPSEARTPRMEALARLPVFFGLARKRAVIAGGTAAAAWKAELISAAGASVAVFAVEPSEELIAVAAERDQSIVIHRRAWQPEDFSGAVIAVGAFESDAQAQAFAAAARAAGVPVNVIDRQRPAPARPTRRRRPQ